MRNVDEWERKKNKKEKPKQKKFHLTKKTTIET